MELCLGIRSKFSLSVMISRDQGRELDDFVVTSRESGENTKTTSTFEKHDVLHGCTMFVAQKQRDIDFGAWSLNFP